MATHPLLFDLGASPTTRDVARIVKEGGVAALPDAVRRGDAATYQEIRCKSALNRVIGKGFMQWSLNPYRGCTHGCHYCFARRYQTQLELNAGDHFASVIFVKTNFVEVLRRELDKPSWKKESIGFGTATDPYQPIEGTYKISRGVLAALRDAATPVGIVTKGPLIVRDIDLLQDLSSRASCRVHMSVPTVDEDAWQRLEPGVAHPMQRLRAVRQLVDAGIDCGVVKLYELARGVAKEMGSDLAEGSAGGGSDGNFTAAVGVPTLDGLGAVGDGAHALHEHVVIDALAPRAALIAGLLLRLVSSS